MDHSPLGRLPPELRLEIDRLAFAHDSDFLLWATLGQSCQGSGRMLRMGRLNQRALKPLALTETCRAVLVESLPEFFALNDFTFGNMKNVFETGRHDASTDGGLALEDLQHLHVWLTSIGKRQAASMTSLGFNFTTLEPLFENVSTTGWWEAMQGSAAQLRAQGLSAACRIYAKFGTNCDPLDYFACDIVEGGSVASDYKKHKAVCAKPDCDCEEGIIEPNFGMGYLFFELPITTREEAVAQVTWTYEGAKKDFKAHAAHDTKVCTYDEAGEVLLEGLDAGRELLLEALGEEFEDEGEPSGSS